MRTLLFHVSIVYASVESHIEHTRTTSAVICDVFKQNESELAKTVCKIQLNKATSLFFFLLFLQSFNCLYFQNQMPHYYGVFTKLKPK